MTKEELEKENTDLKEALRGKVCNCMTYLNFKDLEKENAELKKKCYKKAVKDYCELEKENAELKLKLEALEGQTPWEDIKDKSEVIGQLTKAKEYIKLLLMNCVGVYESTGKTIAEIQAEAEQFLKENA